MTKIKLRNRAAQDATLINVRASQVRWQRLKEQVARLSQRVKVLERAQPKRTQR